MKKLAVLMIAAVFVFFAFTAREAKADLVYDLKYVFNGATNLSGSDWMTASFQTVTPGAVKLTLTSNLSDPNYYIQDVAFNVAPSIAPASLLFKVDSASGTTVSNILHTSQDAQSLIGSGALGKGFDILIQFPTANKDRFNGKDSVVVTITGQSITAESFNYLNAAGAANVGAHLALGGGYSSAITNVNPVPTPIPAAAWLFASGLIGLVGVRRKFKFAN
jgi:hypothetical protein